MKQCILFLVYTVAVVTCSRDINLSESNYGYGRRTCAYLSYPSSMKANGHGSKHMFALGLFRKYLFYIQYTDFELENKQYTLN